MTGPASEASRILIVRPSALGDVARTVPALATLRAAHPRAQIDWLVNDACTDAITAHPALNAVVPFPRKRFAKFGRSIAVTRQVLAYLDDLKQRRYDAVYDLQGLLRSGIFTRATRAARRVGFADARELAWLGYNHKHRVAVVHTVDRMLGLLESDGLAPVRDLRLHVPNTDRQWADRWLADHGLTEARYAIVAPTALWRSKQWPIQRFVALTDRLGDMGIAAAVVVGSPAEVDATRPLFATAHGTPRHDAVGATSVGQLMALIERCELALCNDSAALHLAVGLGRRCVGIFGPTDPARVGPYRYDIGVAAAPGGAATNYRAAKDDQSLIARVGVDAAWQTVRRVMQHAAPRTRWDD